MGTVRIDFAAILVHEAYTTEDKLAYLLGRIKKAQHIRFGRQLLIEYEDRFGN